MENATPVRLPPPRQLKLLAGAIVLVGLACAGWLAMRHRAVAEHPEAAQFRSSAETRVLLADIFRSYEAESAVRTPLEAAGLSVQRSVLTKPKSPRYPPRQMVTLSVAAYQHLGINGRLTLELFNDRLMEVDFRPDDAAAYSARLHRALPGLQRGSTGHAEFNNGDLRVWSNVDLAKSRVGGALHTDALVLWQDLRLIAQRDDWDARFGSIAVPASR